MLAEIHRDAADIDIKKKVPFAFPWLTFERLENEPENVSCRESGEVGKNYMYRIASPLYKSRSEC